MKESDTLTSEGIHERIREIAMMERSRCTSHTPLTFCRITSNELVRYGIAGGGRARGDSELVVDRAEVGVDGARADHQLRGDLGIGETLCQQAQHLHLASTQVISGSRR